MKINKKIIIFAILTIFILFATPILSTASSNYQKTSTEKTVMLARVEQALPDGGGGGETSSKFKGDGSDSPIGNPGYFEPNTSGGDTQVVTSKIAPIVGTITTIGIIVAVATSAILGIKYMVGSVQEKAEYKKTMIPYIIVIVMVVGISVVIKIIVNLIVAPINSI